MDIYVCTLQQMYRPEALVDCEFLQKYIGISKVKLIVILR